MTIDQLLADLEVKLAARRERKMGDYKVVPVEPTAEMVEAYKAMWSPEFCDDRMAQECYAAIIAAAPAVQGEPDVAGLVTLLDHAQCPNCDGSGAFYDGHGQVRQCQWCCERDAALTAHRKGGVQQWQPIGTCPRHVDVIFYREDAGVFSGKFTDADSFMTDKERDEWAGTEEEMFDLDAWSYEPEGVYRMDGDLVPTHWMPLPAPPATQGANQ